MRVVILFSIFAAGLKLSEAGIWTNCVIEGISETDFLMGYYQTKAAIDDTHEGVVIRFQTEHVLAMSVKEVKYLNATFENDVITIFTTENFKNFEKEIKNEYRKLLTIEMDLDCVKDLGSRIEIRQKVNDINNHDPVLNQEAYEYNFAMAIPEDFELTSLLPISAYDDDFTNAKISFTIEANEYFKVGYSGKIKSGTDDYFTSLKALKEIKAPLEQHFTLTATDGGDPTRSAKAKMVINVISVKDSPSGSENEDTDIIHPPVFSKYLYFSNYTSNHDLDMEEPIFIKYGAQNDTVIKQNEYQEYFEIRANSLPEGQIEVKTLQPLSKTILQKDIIVMEIEAENPGLTIPGRTALIIRLKGSQDNSNPKETPNDCEVIYLWGLSYRESIIPIAFCLTSIIIIIFLNIIVLSLYFRRQKRNLAQPTVGYNNS